MIEPIKLLLNGNVLRKVLVLLRCLETRDVWHLHGRGGEDDCVDHADFLRKCMALAEAAPRLRGNLNRSHEEYAREFHYFLIDERNREESAKRRREEDNDWSRKRSRFAGGSGSDHYGWGGYGDTSG